MRTGIVVVLLAAVLLGGCSTPSDSKQPDGSSSSGSVTLGEPMTPQEYLEAVDSVALRADADSLGSAQGGSYRVDVLSVEAWDDATLVTYALFPNGGGAAGDLNKITDGTTGVRAISLYDPETKTSVSPALFRPTSKSSNCLCSEMMLYAPISLGTAWMGPLPERVKTVTVRVATVPDIPDIPVTWR